MSSYGLWLSAAGMKVSDHRQALLANNMANANTTGFKQDLAAITQRTIESRSSAGGFGFAHPVLDGMGGGLNVRPSYHDFSQGPIERTGRPLDVAIEGDGFFVVRNEDETRYTRDGQFVLNPNGELVLVAGGGRWRVLDESGSGIVLDEAGGPPVVSQDGTIRQGKTVVARLSLMDTDDRQSLRKIGGNLFDAGDTKMFPVKVRVAAQSREESNVDVMRGLATMIEAARAYEMNARMIQLQDRMTEQAVTVGRTVR